MPPKQAVLFGSTTGLQPIRLPAFESALAAPATVATTRPQSDALVALLRRGMAENDPGLDNEEHLPHLDPLPSK